MAAVWLQHSRGGGQTQLTKHYVFKVKNLILFSLFIFLIYFAQMCFGFVFFVLFFFPFSFLLLLIQLHSISHNFTFLLLGTSTSPICFPFFTLLSTHRCSTRQPSLQDNTENPHLLCKHFCN